MGERIERVLEANGRFIGWWARNLNHWSQSRQRGLTGWMIHEATWFIVLPLTLLLYVYLAFTFVAGWALRLWYITLPILILGIVYSQIGLPV